MGSHSSLARGALAALCLIGSFAGPHAATALSGGRAPARAVASRGVAANFEFQPIADGVYAVIRKDPPGLMCDGNCVVIVNESDVVVVDAPESSREVVAALRRLTRKPVRYVINTHWHDDHVTGNQVYRDAYPGVEFIAHESVREYLPTRGLEARKQMLAGAPEGVKMLRGLLEKGESLAGGAITEPERASDLSDIALVEHYLAVVPRTEYVLPTVTLRDRLSLQRGTRTIEIRALGAGHTAGDLVVWLPKERIVVSGDLVMWPVPLVGADQSHVATWSGALDSLVALRPAAIVPGHGPVLRDVAYVRLMADLFRSIRAQTFAAVARGETLEQARKSVDLEPFREKFAGEDRVRRILFAQYVAGPAVAAAYREAKAGR